MMRQLFSITISLLFMGLSMVLTTPAWAASDAEFTALLKKLSATEGFSCSFRQVVYFAEGGEKSYTGELAVMRPGKFRWHYRTPYEQLYVSDGGVIWHYEPDLMQAERLQVLDAVDPSALKLLDGRAGAADVTLLSVGKKDSETRSYRVRIGNGPELTLAFRNDDSLYWLQSRDSLGNRNRMILQSVDHSRPAAKLFHFVPPAGVDVVDLTGGGDVMPLHNTETDGE